MGIKEMVKYYGINFRTMGYQKKLCQYTKFENCWADNSRVIVYRYIEALPKPIAKFFTDGRCLVDTGYYGILRLSRRARWLIMEAIDDNYSLVSVLPNGICLYQRIRNPISLNGSIEVNTSYQNNNIREFTDLLTQ